MILVRHALGDQLRRHRQSQQRTLREVSRDARVSLGYLSEVERGRKEPSSELLASICGALDVPLSVVLREVSEDVALQELVDAATPMRLLPLPDAAPTTAEDGPAGERVVVDLAA